VVVGGGGGDYCQQVGKFLHDFVRGGDKVIGVGVGYLGIANEETTRPLANPMDKPVVVGAFQQDFNAIQWVGCAAPCALVGLRPLVNHRKGQSQV